MQRALTKRLALLPLALLVAVGCTHDRGGSPLAAPAATSPSILASKASQLPPGPHVLLMTDKSDYVPGETVVITGTGWKAGSTLRMLLEVEPRTHDPVTFTAVVDARGNF